MPTLSKTKKVLRWAIHNTLLYGFMVLGLFGNLKWAFNIYAFLNWSGLLLSFLLILCKKVTELDPEKKLSLAHILPVPAWLDGLLDVIAIGVLAGFGHWFYAILLVIQTIVLQHIIYQDKQEEKETNA